MSFSFAVSIATVFFFTKAISLFVPVDTRRQNWIGKTELRSLKCRFTKGFLLSRFSVIVDSFAPRCWKELDNQGHAELKPHFFQPETVTLIK